MITATFLIFLLSLSGGLPVFAESDTKEDIEDDISKFEKKLKRETKKINVLEQDLGQINSSLSSTKQLIFRVENLLKQTETTIERKEGEIKHLEKQLILERYILKSLIQEMYSIGDISIASIVLAENNLFKLLHGEESLFSMQEKMQEVIRRITEVRTKITNEKFSLEDTKADQAQLLDIKNKQKRILVSEKIETEDDLEDKQATVAELQSKLQDLKSDLSKLTGKSYSAKNIREAVEFASGKKGVPKGVLYGFLKMETNLGANTGQCTYKQVKKDAINLWYGKSSKWKASRDLLEKRHGIFKDIVKKLGYSKSKKVSCTPRSYRGQGGAMGVSQFMSDVWRGYESRVTAETGHRKPDPWDLTDGVMAMAIKLKGAGATSSKKSVIKKASINYLGGFNSNYYKGIVYWSKNYKRLFQ